MLQNSCKADCSTPVGFEEVLFVRCRSVVSRIVAGETLIVPVRGKVGDLASIYSFNGTGSLIWQCLESPTPLADLITAVERQYLVRPEQAKRDVEKFVNEMLSAGLVELCPHHTSIAIDLEMKMSEMESKSQANFEAAGSR